AQMLLEMAKDLVLAQTQAHQLSPEAMQTALQQTYASLKALQAKEDANGSIVVTTVATPSKPVHWRKSMIKHAVTCLEGGARFPQRSMSHLKAHALDGRIEVRSPVAVFAALLRESDHRGGLIK